MTKTAVVPAEKPFLEATEPLTAEELVAMGDTLSQSLLFVLRRNYLDGPVFEQDYVRLADVNVLARPDLAFMEVEQVGRPVTQNTSEYFRAIQTTLAACHDPRYNLLFVISSDGLRSRVYICVSARVPGTQPWLFAAQLGQFLCSNWPGTRVKAVNDHKRIADDIHVPLSSYRYARALTGIPSIKTVDESPQHPQSLDCFMRGLRGKPYIYMVIAEPMSEGEVGDIISACYTLSGQVHAFARATIQRSRNRGTSESTSRTESTSESSNITHGTSESETAGKSKGMLGTALEGSTGAGKGLKALGMGGLAALLVGAGGPFLLSGMLGMFGQLLPSSTASQTSGESRSESKSTSHSAGFSVSTGTSAGESLSFGREYLSKHAEACIRMLDQMVMRFEIARAQGCWNVGVYLISDQAEAAAQAQAQLRALISGIGSSFEPVRAHDLGPVWDGRVQVALDAFQQPLLRLFAPGEGDQIHHPIGEAFEGLTTPMNTQELSLLANLPLREMPGIPMQPIASFSLNPPVSEDIEAMLSIGTLLEGGEDIGELKYEVDLDTLTRHIFVTGITGSGKSNTCRRLLQTLMEQGRNFMVIEPAKDEYVQLALAYNQAGAFGREIAVYVPGRKEWGGYPLDQLQLNPFDVVRLPGAPTQVMPHMDRLKSIFGASFPMQEILPVILEEALVDLYDSQGWLDDTLPPEGIGCPMLSQLYNRVSGLVRAKGYEDRITNNIIAALRTRIGSLLRGWKGRLFDHPTSTPWADLFDRPVVVNLQLMGDDADKCFTMALLLNFMYEYRQAQHESSGSPESAELIHLAIFEEAHRILRHAPPGWSGDANPQAKMGEMFADILAEIRAYGQGLAIIDQVPSKLVPDALKNTNLKIVHRLVSADDREAMASALALTDEQAQVIARLKVGQAIVCGVQDDVASWVKVFYTPLPRLRQSGREC